MFSRLKEKLKQAVSVFSKKAEEEAQETKSMIESAIDEKSVEKEVILKKEEEKEVKQKEDLADKSAKPEQKKKEKPKKEKLKEEPKKKAEPKETTGSKKEIEAPEAEVKESEEKISAAVKEEETIEEEKAKKKEPEKPVEEKPSFFKRIFGKKEETLAEEEKAKKKEPEKTAEKKAEAVPEEKNAAAGKKTEIKVDAKEEKTKKAAKEETSGSKEKTAAGHKEEIEEFGEKPSFFDKVKISLTTKKISVEKFEELFWDLELVLLENNVSVEVIEKIKDDLKAELVDKPLPRDVLKKIEETLKRTLTEILSFDKVDLLKIAGQKEKPLVIAFFGINGTGKTTSIAKLAYYFQKNKMPVVLAACDTFRAAAIQQLEEHADRLGIKIIKHDYGADAAAVAFDAVKYAEKNQIKVVLLDTAGRLHSNTNLMQELEKIIRVAKPDLKIFVGESITGNDCIEQAKQFHALVEMDGAILTKADVDEKGGAPLSIAYTIKKPILFLGTGQSYEDLEAFDPETIIQRLGL